MTKAEEKQRLRRVIRELERQLSPRYKAESSRAIAAHLLAMPEYQTAGTVFCFVGTKREVDTRPILEDALAAGKRLCVPLCTEPGIMELRQVTSLDQLVPGTYGILEPLADAPKVDVDEVDFAILPCVTCNHLGQRLGQGGGYYDRFLPGTRALRVGICPDFALLDAVPLRAHDGRMDGIVTPERTIWME